MSFRTQEMCPPKVFMAAATAASGLTRGAGHLLRDRLWFIGRKTAGGRVRCRLNQDKTWGEGTSEERVT